jgi:hypothetical protein
MIVIEPETIPISMSPAMDDKNKCKKRVKWSDSCRVRPFRMVSASEQDLCWYGQKDYREFKKERKAAALLAEAIVVEAIEETDFVSCRGIECMVDKEVYEKKVKVQRRTCVAVLSAQLKVFEAADSMGEEANLISFDIIPREYSKCSRLSHTEAAQRALREWVSSGELDLDTTPTEHDLPSRPAGENRSFQNIAGVDPFTSSLMKSPRKESMVTCTAPFPGRAGGKEDWTPSRWSNHLSFQRRTPTLDIAPSATPPVA